MNAGRAQQKSDVCSVLRDGRDNQQDACIAVSVVAAESRPQAVAVRSDYGSWNRYAVAVTPEISAREVGEIEYDATLVRWVGVQKDWRNNKNDAAITRDRDICLLNDIDPRVGRVLRGRLCRKFGQTPKRRRCFSLKNSIDVLSVTNSDHVDNQFSVLNPIQNPVSTLPDTIALIA